MPSGWKFSSRWAYIQGYCYVKSRGMRTKADLDDKVAYLIDPDIDSKEFRKRRSCLIQKVYSRELLICPKRSRKMKVIARF